MIPDYLNKLPSNLSGVQFHKADARRLVNEEMFVLLSINARSGLFMHSSNVVAPGAQQ